MPIRIEDSLDIFGWRLRGNDILQLASTFGKTAVDEQDALRSGRRHNVYSGAGDLKKIINEFGRSDR